MEEAPRSYADLEHDAAETIERVNDPLRADRLAQRFELSRLARIVAEIAQRLAGDTDTADDGPTPDDFAAWRYEVANGDTVRGLAEWIAASDEANGYDAKILRANSDSEYR